MAEWLKQINENVKKLKSHASTGDELISSMKAKGYIISYPETFKKIYWNENE